MRTTRAAALGLTAALLAAPAARAADLTPLFPDTAWLVIGAEVKAIHESPFGKAVFAADGRFEAARKLLLAVGYQAGTDVLKPFTPLGPALDRAARVTIVAPLDSGTRRQTD